MFGKPKDTVGLGSLLLPSASTGNSANENYKPAGVMVGRKDLNEMRKSSYFFKNKISDGCRQLKFDVNNFDNKFAFEKPTEVSQEVIEAVIDLQRFHKDELKEICGDLNVDYERANWAELLVPDSIRNIYQDNEYRANQRRI